MGSNKVCGSELDAAAWCMHYEAAYTSKSQALSAARARRRQRNRPLGVPPTGTELVLRDVKYAQDASKRAAIDLRVSRGFEWKGGAIAGNPDYWREPFCYIGLVSSQHPILQLFVSKLHRAKNLRVGDNKADSIRSDSKLLALDASYVEANKVACGILRIEVDTILPWADVTKACTGAGIPLPNLVVGYEDSQGRINRPHLLWLLAVSGPLLATSRKARAFQALYQGVLRGLTNALLPLGADLGGLMNAHRHKNPLCPTWTCQILAEAPYSLAELAASVDTRITMETVKAAADLFRSPKRGLEADHPDPEVAAGSNALFLHLAYWARSEVVRLRSAGGSEQEFRSLVAQEAQRLGALLDRDVTRTEPIISRLAYRVANWTWNCFRAPSERRAPLSGERLRERLRQGQAISAATRTTRTRDAIVAAAASLSQQGQPVTQAAVLALVRPAGIRGEKTIRRHWKFIKE